MSDIKIVENEKKRPNADYPISKTNHDENEMIFRYSRERRLEKAPQTVQDLYASNGKKKSGFLRSLTATRPLAILFVSILVLSALIMVISFLGLAENSRILGGNKLTISGIRYGGETFLVLTKTYTKEDAVYTGLIDIAVSPVVSESGVDFPIFNHRIFFSLNTEEDYRFSVPFDSEELIVILQGEKNSVNFRVKPK